MCHGIKPRASSPPSSKAGKIVSFQIYMNEEDLLFIRFVEHSHFIDYFVILEAPSTFSGNPKPLNFQPVICTRFAEFVPRIVHVVLHSIHEEDGMASEPAHRVRPDR